MTTTPSIVRNDCAAVLSLRGVGTPIIYGKLPSAFRRGSAVFDRMIDGNQEIVLLVLPERAA
jgi:hypothetical protein